jgi:hypothetical protein
MQSFPVEVSMEELIVMLFICDCVDVSGNALIALKTALKDSKNLLSTWDPSLVDPCISWFRVNCNSDGRVTSL